MKDKLLCQLIPPVLCAALLSPEGNSKNAALAEKLNSAKAPSCSFRAASLANLTIRPLKGAAQENPLADYSFEWKISQPVWLPAYRDTVK